MVLQQCCLLCAMTGTKWLVTLEIKPHENSKCFYCNSFGIRGTDTCWAEFTNLLSALDAEDVCEINGILPPAWFLRERLWLSCCVGMLGLGCESSWMFLFIQGGIRAALLSVGPRFWPREAAGKDLPRGCPGSRAPAAGRRQQPRRRAAGQAAVPERALEHMDVSA